MGLYAGNKFVIRNGDFIVNEGSSTGIGTTENEKLIASDGAAGDRFGSSVAVGSGRIVVGANYDDDNGSQSGSAYIFDLDGNQLGIITASDGATNDYFGESVAVGSGRIVVGAKHHNVGSNVDQGSAYIFDLNGNQLGIITASDGAASDFFGFSVAVGCGRIVVGAYGNDDNGSVSGSAYIFDLDGNQLGIITASDGAAGDNFGRSVAVGSGRIVVGALYNDVGSNTDQGSAYIFDLDGNQLGIITASDGAVEDLFGHSVAVGCGRIVVGAPHDDDIDNYSGAAYIFDLNGNELSKKTVSDGSRLDLFGHSVAVGLNKIIVGGYGDVEGGSTPGFAYVYDLDGNQLTKITASDGVDYDGFGYSVAVGSGRIVSGAANDTIGSNSFQGSAYMWEIDEPLSGYYDDIVDNYRY